MAQPSESVIVNGRLITFDPERPRADALAIRGGRIAALGSAVEIRALTGPGTRVVDAGGATVLPGFIDSHVHLLSGSVELGYRDLYSVTGEDALTAEVRGWAAQCPDDRIVCAVQADYAILGEGRAPPGTIWTGCCPTARSPCSPPITTPSGPTRRRWRQRACCMALGSTRARRS